MDLRSSAAEMTEEFPMCTHQPHCPTATDHDRNAARVVRSHPEQGWSLLCNGVVAFDDTGDLLPDGHAVEPTHDRSRMTASGRALSLVA